MLSAYFGWIFLGIATAGNVQLGKTILNIPFVEMLTALHSHGRKYDATSGRSSIKKCPDTLEPFILQNLHPQFLNFWSDPPSPRWITYFFFYEWPTIGRYFKPVHLNLTNDKNYTELTICLRIKITTFSPRAVLHRSRSTLFQMKDHILNKQWTLDIYQPESENEMGKPVSVMIS